MALPLRNSMFKSSELSETTPAVVSVRLVYYNEYCR
jgi:hypothetical protein